eukprot:Nk52_evm22s156 gene=Nk52_evmTU22s156
MRGREVYSPRRGGGGRGSEGTRKGRSRGVGGGSESPPRRRKRNDSDSDLSPPRRKRRNDSGSDLSPPRKGRRNDSDSDLSPQRKGRRRARKSVLSPPKRNRRNDSDSDPSPPRTNRRNDSDSDLSPPRKNRRNDSNSDLSPPRKNTRNDNDSDLSPPRRSRRNDSDLDMSPPRKGRKKESDSDLSPPRKGKRKDSGSDLSPTRKSRGNDSDSDLSPPRTRKRKESLDSDRDSASPEGSSEKAKAEKVLLSSGARAGLQSGEDARKEAERLRSSQKERYERADPELLGRGAETVHRDKSTGKKLDAKLEKLKQREAEAEEAAKMEKYMKWGKGVVQQSDKEKRLADDLYEASKPFARGVDDEDREALLKGEDRDGDPMANYFAKKKAKKKRRKRDDDEFEFPPYTGPMGPPNRFNIKPGHRWDGVDRSNGFEKEYFKAISAQKARDNSYQEWSNLND